MGRTLLLAAALLVAPAPGAGADLVLGASAGGGWDSNVSGAPAGEPRVDAGFGEARAWLGGAFEPSLDDVVALEAGYAGTRYPDVPDLDLDRPSLTLWWLHGFGERAVLRIAPVAALRFQGDPLRDGWEVGGDLSVRVSLSERLSLRAGGGGLHRVADDPAFSGDVGRARAGLELDLWRGAWIGAGYTLAFGEDTFYAEVLTASAAAPLGETASGGMGPGRPGTGPGGQPGTIVPTFGADLVAYVAPFVAHTVSVDLAQAFGEGFLVRASVEGSDVDGEDQRYRALSVFLSVGFSR